MAKASVNQDSCTGCGECESTCPTSAITLTDGKAKVDEDTCVECGACVTGCPASAISQ
jgi:ferredoxin